MGPLYNPWRSGLCRWPGPGLPHPQTHSGEEISSQHICPADRPKEQPGAVRGDDPRHPKLFTGRCRWMENIYPRLRSSLTSAALPGIKSRRSKTRNAFEMFSNVWRPRQYSISTKLKLYQSYVLCTVVYGSDCWGLTVTLKSSPFSTQRTCEESQHRLKRAAACSLPPTDTRQRGYHHHENTVEVDTAHAQERAS